MCKTLFLKFFSGNRDSVAVYPTLTRCRQGEKHQGITLIELLIAVVVVGLLSAIAIPTYQSYVDRARNAQAIADIALIASTIERYRSVHFRLPPDLAALGAAIPPDPWGNEYRYLNIENGGPGITGKARKDRNLVPINSDYDLYSMGRDGKTATPLPAEPARDDVIRAMNGSFIGLARDY